MQTAWDIWYIVREYSFFALPIVGFFGYFFGVRVERKRNDEDAKYGGVKASGRVDDEASIDFDHDSMYPYSIPDGDRDPSYRRARFPTSRQPSPPWEWSGRESRSDAFDLSPAPLPPAAAPPSEDRWDRDNLPHSGPVFGAEKPEDLPARPEDGSRIYRVGYATNRALSDPLQPNLGFSQNRGNTTVYGNCDVHVPKSHKIGSVGSTFLRRFVTGTDDRLKLTRILPLDENAFYRSLNSRVATDAGRHAVVFIHGYNVSFAEAIVRAAQIGVDLGIGAMAVFSWPSRGLAKAYPSDEASIEASTGAITDFLVRFASQVQADGIHVIAHSMGNRGLLRAIERIGSDAERRSGVKFSQFILAAPDVDIDSFREMAHAYSAFARRTTLYVSERDRAVALSKWLHDYPRVGFVPPISIFDGIDTINVTNIDVSLLGHG